MVSPQRPPAESETRRRTDDVPPAPCSGCQLERAEPFWGFSCLELVLLHRAALFGAVISQQMAAAPFSRAEGDGNWMGKGVCRAAPCWWFCLLGNGSDKSSLGEARAALSGFITSINERNIQLISRAQGNEISIAMPVTVTPTLVGGRGSTGNTPPSSAVPNPARQHLRPTVNYNRNVRAGNVTFIP